MAKKINDFGKKIGGARKDFYTRSELISNLSTMTDVEKLRLITKDKIWPSYKAVKLVEEGADPVLLYWKNEMRKACGRSPKDSHRRSIENYISVLTDIRDKVNSVECKYDAEHFFGWLLSTYLIPQGGRYVSVREEAADVVDRKLILISQKNFRYFQQKADKTGYGLTKLQKKTKEANSRLSIGVIGEDLSLSYEDDGRLHIIRQVSAGSQRFYYGRQEDIFVKREHLDHGCCVLEEKLHRPLALNLTREEADFLVKELTEKYLQAANELKDDHKPKKKHFAIPELEKVERNGDVHLYRHATGDDFLKLGFRAGEFGNWLSDADRQASLDHCYDAFRDLAEVLEIRPKDISLDSSLAIAFGARGKGGPRSASAHYEPARKVINLTKLKGMGCLAHEWGHALDDYIGNVFGVSVTKHGTMASEADFSDRRKLPQSFQNILSFISRSNFAKQSKSFDFYATRAEHGYWGSNCEMFARAFDCYVSDKLKDTGNVSGYLTSHANCYVMQVEREVIRAYPVGKEREELNQLFDRLFDELKELKLFREQKVEHIKEHPNVFNFSAIVDDGEFQLSFRF